MSEVNISITTEAERRGLEILKLGEEEDEVAGLASVGVRDVKVEHSRDGRTHGTVKPTSCGCVGRGRVDRNNKVRDLVVTRLSTAQEGSGTGTAGGSSG